MSCKTRPRHRLARLVVYAALAFASFLVVASLVRFFVWQVAGLNEYDPLTQKIARAEEKMPVDALFIGPSYIDGGIDAALFDKEMALLDRPMTSFNLGIGSLGFVEMQNVVKEVLERKHCCKYILLDPMFNSLILATSSDSVRTILFMNMPHAIEQAEFVLSLPQLPNYPMTRSRYLTNIITAMFLHYTNAGLGSTLLGLTNVLIRNGNWKLASGWDSRGYSKFPDTYNPAAVNNGDYGLGLSWMIRDRPGYLARAATDTQPIAERVVSAEMVDQFVEMGKQIEAAGAIPLVLLPPVVGEWPWEADFTVKFVARCGDSHMLDFDDPEAFPTVFDLAMRYDGSHLNGLGAPVWTKLVAKELADKLSNGELAHSFCRQG
jgi:hypothetical protein